MNMIRVRNRDELKQHVSNLATMADLTLAMATTLEEKAFPKGMVTAYNRVLAAIKAWEDHDLSDLIQP